jgi:hypothetical protein
MHSSYASQLTNKSALSLVVAMTCLNGYFIEPAASAISLGESLLQAPNGGAVAVWSSTGETGLSGQIVMDEKALSLILAGSVTLGDAMRQAKATVNDIDVRHTWVLLGDPTTRLH